MRFADVRHGDFPVIKDMGWHFSYTGGADRISKKILTGGHMELATEKLTNVDYIKQKVENVEDLFDRKDYQFQMVKLDRSYPKYLLENISKYSYLVRKK
jgi:beta-1,4-mannosyl-glycoprotein beta-1,4-N-acetylglucosaminyltransferase